MGRRDYPWWTRAWWAVERTASDWYWEVHALFEPHNVQKIRNVPRTWNNRSERLLHCVFSMLCDFVERECYDYGSKKSGRDGLVARIAWLLEDAKKDPCVQPQCESEIELLALYDWYRAVNWDMPDGIDWGNEDVSTTESCAAITKREDDWYETEQQMLIRAIRNRGRWWT